jgi:hypothetical protein
MTPTLPERRYAKHNPVRLHANCTRAVYQGLKKAERRRTP